MAIIYTEKRAIFVWKEGHYFAIYETKGKEITESRMGSFGTDH